MSFLLSPSEIEYYRNVFLESLRLYGVPAKYYAVDVPPSQQYDRYDDVEVTTPGVYKDPFDTFVTFETTPNVKTLKSLGWYLKGDEDLPYICQLPVVFEGIDIRPKKDDIIELLTEYAGEGTDMSRRFLIKDFKGQGHPNVIYWVCKLVPLDVNRP